MAANPFLLAADNSPALLPLLRENPALASEQDNHGYSLVHAAASYNHLDLLRALIREFNVDVNLRDEDEETALFVVETVDAARVLVEELGADIAIIGSDGYTARQKIAGEDDFPEVAEYLQSKEATSDNTQVHNLTNGINGHTDGPPPLPEGIHITSTVAPAEEEHIEVDSELRRRIEQLAGRDDFNSESGQAELRRLIQDAVADQSWASRNVRPRQD
ncbi:ankyrin repeat-containing protein [Annulohypoxylon maeteangense]|uniref:ankyrin repeat-containing protein n=1 Tax=Annulohypoxylon maeteangense TaxID=1927788 RepID=UPI0020073DC4|nr:ankyrin repeat-containing protein [Annulohypoxylon maeteangense]KAI0882979.1 ankyrin repeat-containing protein [Annulohypoxylon maeteangense]